MKINVEDFFISASYRSSTTKEGFYCFMHDMNKQEVVLTPARDFNRSFREFSSDYCPLYLSRSRRKIYILFPLRVETGQKNDKKIVGAAAQYINISGTVTLIPEQNETLTRLAYLTVKSDMEGNIETKLAANLKPPSAKLEIVYAVDNFGTFEKVITAFGSQAQTTTISAKGTVGMTGPAPTGSLEGGASHERKVEMTPDGVLAISNNNAAWVPVNTPLVWRISLQMQARNDEDSLTATTAISHFKFGVIEFAFVPIRDKTGPSSAPTTPMYADGQTNFADPSILLNKVTGDPYSEKDIESARRVVENPQNAPKLRHIVQSGQFTPEDPMVNSILSLSGFNLKGRDFLNDQYFFEDAELRILDGSDAERELGHGVITDIVADGRKGVFSGRLRQLNFNRQLMAASEYAKGLEGQDGQLYIETDLIETSQGFIRNAIARFPSYLELRFAHQDNDKVLSAYASRSRDVQANTDLVKEAEGEIAVY